MRDVFGVVDGFVEELGDVVVLQPVGEGAPRALTVDEPERPKLSPWVSQAAPRAG